MDVRTSCKKCCFAEYTENTQMSCSAGMLDNFQNAGVEVKEVYDEDKEYFVIEGRICNKCRPVEWSDKHSNEDLLSLVENETALKLHVVIPVINSTYEDIYHSISELKKQTLRPSKVTVALNQDGIVPSQIISHLRECDFEWSVYTCLDRTPEGKRVDEARFLDHTLANVNESFFMILEPGHHIDVSVIANVDYALNKKLKRFSLLEGENFYIVHTPLYKHFMGNRDVVAGDASGEEMPLGDIREKIRWAAKVENQSHMISSYPWESQ